MLKLSMIYDTVEYDQQSLHKTDQYWHIRLN